MTITVSTADPRSLKALALLEGADRWQKGHTKDGRSFYAVPSQSGTVLHMADTRACTCRDYERRQHTPAEIAEGSAKYAELFCEGG